MKGGADARENPGPYLRAGIRKCSFSITVKKFGASKEYSQFRRRLLLECSIRGHNLQTQ
jgi:hypothetical protein